MFENSRYLMCFCVCDNVMSLGTVVNSKNTMRTFRRNIFNTHQSFTLKEEGWAAWAGGDENSVPSLDTVSTNTEIHQDFNRGKFDGSLHLLLLEPPHSGSEKREVERERERQKDSDGERETYSKYNVTSRFTIFETQSKTPLSRRGPVLPELVSQRKATLGIAYHCRCRWTLYRCRSNLRICIALYLYIHHYGQYYRQRDSHAEF